jgi:hypothetical protein
MKPVLIVFLVFAFFSIAYLRASFVKLEYSLGELEQRKMNSLRERKMLLAEKASLLTFAKLEDSRNDREGFVLPDRIKVIHVDKTKKFLPYKASLERGQLTVP